VRVRKAGWLGAISIVLSTGLAGTCAAGSSSAAVRTVRASDTGNGSSPSSLAVMDRLAHLAAAGKGKIAVILPDTVSSTRYAASDEPDFTSALTATGLSPTKFVVQNALGRDATALTDAEADIANGATVLVVDPPDSSVGLQIERYAKSKGVQVIDYDHLTLGGSRAYYVGFDSARAGRLMGQGLVRCVATWHVAKPNIVVVPGAANDATTASLASGYGPVLTPLFKSGRWVQAARTTGTWDPAAAEAQFEAAALAHHGVNAALVPSDEIGASLISYLEVVRIKPKTFPITGLGTTPIGLDDVLTGYQCGTAFEPVDREAQAAVALALYLRAGRTPPTSLVNGRTQDTTARASVPSVLVAPEWVTAQNMESAVIASGSMSASQVCAGKFAAACKAAGITP